MSKNNCASITKVTLRVSELTPSQAKDFFTQWGQYPGVHTLTIKVSKKYIKFHYDVLELSLFEILDSLSARGLTLHSGWLTRWRLHLAKQVEQNICDNLNHQPHCCAKAPSKALMNK